MLPAQPNTKIQNFLLILLTIFILSFLFKQPTYAENSSTPKSWAIQTPQSFMNCIDGTIKNQEICGQAYSGLFIPESISYGLSCKIIGYPCSETTSYNQYFKQQSLFYKTTNLIATLYKNPPANKEVWLADTVSNLGLLPKAYAQGIGFTTLTPTLELWKVFRNTAYALLIVILLIIGLMIMFRTKVDPRTVISIQMAIPRIIITILLITFSYPIAGLLIDLMYLTLFIGIRLIGSTANLGTIPELQQEFTSGGGIWRLLNLIPRGNQIGGLLNLGSFLFLLTPASFIGPAIVHAFTGLLDLFTDEVSFDPGGIFLLFTSIIILLTILRIFMLLITSYINIIIAVIFAPVLLIGQAIPGQNTFSSWIRNLMANLSVFPTTAILILVANALSSTYQKSNLPFWNPPMLGFGKEIGNLIIGIGFGFVIPSVAVSVKKMFGTKPPISVSGSFGQAVSQPFGLTQQLIQTIGAFKTALHHP